jgi:predicted dehydrogenase
MHDSSTSNDYNRREFIKGGSLATLMTMLGGVELIAQTAAPEEPKRAGAKVKVAVIGCGTWGREILKTLGRLPMAEVVAICDTYAPAMKKCAADAPGAKQVASYTELLADKAVQAVIIATPTHQHADIALAAIKAGKHVYCEAPLAGSIADAKAIALAAKAAPRQIFQSGLQMRSDAQRSFLMPHIHSNLLGTFVMARSQWNRKQSWRAASANADREKALNWRLERATSLGLIGEIGIHQFDQVGWFLNSRPLAITGFHSLLEWKDGRDVPDTVQAVFEYPKGVIYNQSLTLTNSFDADYEVYSGTYGALLLRENKGWMFKEVDAPLLGWEVYCAKHRFFRETGLSLKAGASKQTSILEPADVEVPPEAAPLYQSLYNFLYNTSEQDDRIANFIEAYGADDPAALLEYLKTEVEPKRKPAAGPVEGFNATVTAIKANEAILSGQRMEFKDEWYQLS